MRTCIIVYGDKDRAFASLFQALAPEKTDVVFALWDEKHYESNLPTLSSNQKLVFFGSVEESEILSPYIKWHYEDGAAKYGWLGNRAVVTVDKTDIHDSLLKQDEAPESDENETPCGAPKRILGSITQQTSKALRNADEVIQRASNTKEVNRIYSDAYYKLIAQFIEGGIEEFMGTES